MATRYELVCDVCGKLTKELSASRNVSKEVERNQWRIDIDNSWWDDTPEGFKELKKERQVSLETCLACAKEAADLLNTWAWKKGYK